MSWVDNYIKYKNGERDAKLHSWATIQRDSYNSGKLSEKRINLLKVIKFNFTKRNYKKSINVIEEIDFLEKEKEKEKDFLKKRIDMLIIIKKSDIHTSNKYLSEVLNVTELTIIKWKNKYKNKCLVGLLNYGRVGFKKPLIDDELITLIKNLKENGQINNWSDVYSFIQERGFSLKENSIYKYLKKKGFKI